MSVESNNIYLEGSADPLKVKCFDIEDIINFVNTTCLADKCCFLHKDIETIDICKSFMKLLDDTKIFKEINALLVVASMVYFYKQNQQNLSWRESLLFTTFRTIDIKDPIQIHILSKNIWDNVISKHPDYILNVHYISYRIDTEGASAKQIAICLSLKIIAEISETKMNFFGLSKLNSLLDMLNKIDVESLKKPENITTLFILFSTTKFLFGVLVSDCKFLGTVYPKILTRKTDIVCGIGEWLRFVHEKCMSIVRQENKYQVFNIAFVAYMALVNEFRDGFKQVDYLDLGT